MKQETVYRIAVLLLLAGILAVQIITMARILVVTVKGTVDVDVQNSSLDVEVQNTKPWEVQVVR
jgi:hypothetical protein